MRGALDVGHVGGRLDPRQACLGEGDVPTPSVHRDDVKDPSDSKFALVISSKLPGRHAVAHGHGIPTHEGGERRIEDVALHGTTDRIRAVENDHGDALLGRRLHGERHRRSVRPVARANVLEVHQKDLDSVEHLRRWTAHGAVQGMDRYSRLEVDGVLDRFSRGRRAADTVLRCEESHELHGRVLMEAVDRGAARGVHPRLIGDQPDSESGYQMQRVLQEDLDPRSNGAEPLAIRLV